MLQIKVSLPPTELQSFKGKRVLVAIADRPDMTRLTSLFSTLGCQVTSVRDKSAQTQQSYDSMDLLVLDYMYMDIARYAKRRGVPVLGIGRGMDEGLANTYVKAVPTSWEVMVRLCEPLLNYRQTGARLGPV